MLVQLWLVFVLSSWSVKSEAMAQRSPRPRPISDGISNMANIFIGGLQNTQQILQGGLDTAVGQFSNITNMVQNTTKVAIATGHEMVVTAMEKMSLPSISLAATLSISKTNHYLRLSGRDVQSLPPLTTSLWGFGSLNSSEGRLARLSTLMSDGPVRVNMRGAAIRVAVPIRLGELTATYDNYTFSTWGTRMTGNITVRVQENGFVAHISLLTTAGCAVNVERVETVRFRDLDLQITGLCNFCSAIATFILNYLQSTINEEVQKAIDTGLKQLLNKESALFCSRITSNS